MNNVDKIARYLIIVDTEGVQITSATLFEVEWTPFIPAYKNRTPPLNITTLFPSLPLSCVSHLCFNSIAGNYFYFIIHISNLIFMPCI